MNAYIDQLRTAIQAITISSPTNFAWFGDAPSSLTPAMRRGMTPQIARSYLLVSLQGLLYERFYCQGVATPMARNKTMPQTTDNTPFVEKLSAANQGTGCWEPGWMVLAIDEGYTLVRRCNGLMLWVLPQEFMSIHDAPIVSGTMGAVRYPKELRAISPGFYMALGDLPLVCDEQQPLIRFYWNVRESGAVPFMRMMTTMLNQARVPFRLKLLADPKCFDRCDTGVVYVRKCDYAASVRIFEKLYPQLFPHLRQGIPALTKPLASGLGLAESPNASESFGRQRCRVLADGLIRAYEQGEHTIEGRLGIVLEHFAAEGISIDAPFLNAESIDRYVFHPQPTIQTTWPVKHPLEGHTSTTLLIGAEGIGRRLVRAALWYNERCTWMGIAPHPRQTSDQSDGQWYRALGADIYTGTSGVALFLAELALASGDSDARRTALGAIRQAIDITEQLALPEQLGLYTGWTGIALAAARTGIVLGEASLIDHATHLLKRCWDVHHQAHTHDILSGRAGAIIALTLLRDLLDAPCALELAARLAEPLIRSLEIHHHRSTSVGFSNGFVDGAAGVGYALLELFQVTGDERYRKAAAQALTRVRGHIATPDLDIQGLMDGNTDHPTILPHAFAYGTPGIALAWLRACTLLDDTTYRPAALMEIRTTRWMIEQALRTRISISPLDQHLVSNAEVLLEGRAVLGPTCDDDMALVHTLAITSSDYYSERTVNRYEEVDYPGLLTGMAGVGYFYLRLHDPAIPSILAPRRGSWGQLDSRSTAHEPMQSLGNAQREVNTTINRDTAMPPPQRRASH